jgi:hypothetical protein
MVWALTSAVPTKTSTGKKHDKYVSCETVLKLSELTEAVFATAMKEQRLLKLIKQVIYEKVPCVSMLYNLSKEEMGIDSGRH